MSRDHRKSRGQGASRRGAEDIGDRRGDARNLALLLRVAVLIRGEARQLCLVRNLAAGGLMARTFSRLEPGEAVAVELTDGEPLPARIVWTQGYETGIAFERPIALTEALAPPSGGRARPLRLPLDRLTMVRAGADIAFASARDISPNGARLACEHPLEQGAAVTLTFEGFRPIEGVVRWRRGSCCGIGFNHAIAPAELGRWLAS
ncbi:PilZ domain-containing protein [Sphingosinicella terrae]|uniref:PilZ domain-containing protein n=1 Tax=Sphingosinicella terrae TaxID=2172047 RepID=UPI000E0DC47F|nr:PilZ domain-containing protein [Sphingosinicella terrae]